MPDSGRLYSRPIPIYSGTILNGEKDPFSGEGLETAIGFLRLGG